MTPTPYEQLGGEDGLRRLVHRFYELMDQLPEAQAIRRMHPAEIASSEEKLFLFLSGWMGGPSLYLERFGHPRLRMRHLPFPIGEAERDQWMLCMERALRDQGVAEPLFSRLVRAFAGVADHMRNQSA